MDDSWQETYELRREIAQLRGVLIDIKYAIENGRSSKRDEAMLTIINEALGK